MSSPLPYMQFYHKEWLASSSVRCLSLAGRGLYIELLGFQWEDGYIPDDVAQIARMVGATPKEIKAEWPKVREQFEEFEIGKLRQKRMQKDREDTIALVAKNRENGAKGGRPKTKENANVSLFPNLDDLADANRTVSETEANGNRTVNPNETERVPQTKAIPYTDTYTDTINTPLSPQGESESDLKESCRTLTLTKVGDFYEAYGEDAEILAKALNITLTRHGDRPMAGVPSYAREKYLMALLGQGIKTEWLEPEQPKTLAWWVGCSDPVSKLALKISEVTIQGGKCPYGEAVLSRAKLEKLLFRVSEIDPGGGFISLLEAFAEYHATKCKSPYLDPIRALGDWVTKREGDWATAKRARSHQAKTVGQSETAEQKIARINMELMQGVPA